jgi:DNA end-binding protein Ku
LQRKLVRHFLGKLEIEAYHDEFREAVMELIKAKIAGKEIKVAPEKEIQKVVSLMEALKKSLGKKPKRKAG